MRERDNQRTILVVDDSLDTLEVLRRNLEAGGYRVYCATGVPQAVQLLGKETVDVVITDLKMPGVSGIELVRHVRLNLKETEVLMITGYPSVEGAVAAMRNGAADYLPKPFTSAELLAAIECALDRLRARQSMQGPTEKLAPSDVAGLLGASRAMQPVFQAIREHANGVLPILIRGETGTGMRTVARALHKTGPQSAGRFVEFDCDATAGPFELPAEGSLYLAEIDSLDRVAQERLTEALEGTLTARIFASSSIDLVGMVERGAFSERLYARFSGIQILLPPLRDRENDVLLLARHFAGQTAARLGLPAPVFADRTLETLRNYPWPGNVLELWWTIRRLVAEAKGERVEVPDLPTSIRFSAQGPAASLRSLVEVEAAHIQEVLAAANGNRTRAAEILGIDRKTLREKIRRSSLV